MTDKQRAKNCEKCKIRQSQAIFMNTAFDYRNCPFVCLQNKIDNGGRVKRWRRR